MKHRTARLAAGVLLAAIVTFVGWTGPAEAAPPGQTGTPVKLLELVEGTLDAATPAASYTFRLNEGFPFSVTGRDTTGSLGLSVTITGPTGQTLATSQPLSDDPTFHVVDAILAPATGNYTATVTRTGMGSGAYSLLVLPGYASLQKYDDFELAGDDLSLIWTPSSSDANSWDVVGGAAELTVFAPNMLSYFQPDDALSYDNLYIESDVRIEGWPSYYEYGLLVHLGQDPEAFYAITFSSDSDWSVYYFGDGGWTAIQKWTQTPVVDGADKNPRIGVMVRDKTFRAYFNDQFVGEVTDSEMRVGEGSIAVVAATRDGQTDTLTIYHDNLVITTPLLEKAAQAGDALGGLAGMLSGLTQQGATPTSQLPFGMAGQATPKPTSPPPPTAVPASPTPSASLVNWASSRPSDIVDELRQMGLVPAGGSVAMTVPTSFGDTSSSGFNFYPLGQSRRFRNFVLTFDAHLDITGAESGCGMHFRNNGSTSISIGMVTEDGAAFLGQINNGELHAASVFEFAPSVVAGQGSVNRVTVVAVEEAMRMYVNGELAAAGTFDAFSGTVALEVYVAEDDLGRTQRTYCQLDNVWLWEF